MSDRPREVPHPSGYEEYGTVYEPSAEHGVSVPGRGQEAREDFLGEPLAGALARQAAAKALRRFSYHSVGACRDGNGDEYGFAVYFYRGPGRLSPFLTVGGYGSAREAVEAIPRIQFGEALKAYQAALEPKAAGTPSRKAGLTQKEDVGDSLGEGG